MHKIHHEHIYGLVICLNSGPKCLRKLNLAPSEIVRQYHYIGVLIHSSHHLKTKYPGTDIKSVKTSVCTAEAKAK